MSVLRSLQGSFLGDDVLGELHIATRDLCDGELSRGWHTLQSKLTVRTNTEAVREDLGEVELSLQCVDGRVYRNSQLRVSILQARGMYPPGYSGRSHPRCELSHGGAEATTTSVEGTLAPHWDETFVFEYHIASPLKVHVFDHDDRWFRSQEFGGHVEIPVNRLQMRSPVQEWYTLYDALHREDPRLGQIEVIVEWLSSGVDQGRASLGCLEVEVLRARGLQIKGLGGKSVHPYVVLRMGSQEQRTQMQTHAPLGNHSVRWAQLAPHGAMR